MILTRMESIRALNFSNKESSRALKYFFSALDFRLNKFSTFFMILGQSLLGEKFVLVVGVVVLKVTLVLALVLN